MVRKAIVSSAVSNSARSIDTSAENWGQLKAELNKCGIITDNAEAVLEEGKLTLSHPDAALPPGDFRLFLVPTKNKAGTMESIHENFQEVMDSIRKGAIKATPEQVSALKGRLIETIERFYDEEDLTVVTEANT